jgi:NDP-sugar pyrophosphorylase family protein
MHYHNYSSKNYPMRKGDYTKTKAVILAGGLIVRLKPFTEVIPKPLLPVGEKAIMELQIEQLKSYGFDDIFLATNYKSDYISNFSEMDQGLVLLIF